MNDEELRGGEPGGGGDRVRDRASLVDDDESFVRSDFDVPTTGATTNKFSDCIVTIKNE